MNGACWLEVRNEGKYWMAQEFFSLVVSLKVSALRFLFGKCFQEIFLNLQEISSCPMEPVTEITKVKLRFCNYLFETTKTCKCFQIFFRGNNQIPELAYLCDT